MLQITAVDPHDDRRLRDWYAALARGTCSAREAAFMSSYGSMTFTMRHPGPVRRRIPVAAYDDGSAVGAMLLELPLLDDTETFEVEIAVPEEHRRRGTATALWQHALAEVDGRTMAQTEVHVPADGSPEHAPGYAFATTLGFASELVEDHLVLDLPAQRESVVAGGYRTRGWSGQCPESEVAEFAALQTAMNADVPTGGMTRTAVVVEPDRVRTSEARLAQSYRSLVTLCTTADGEPVGYTQLLVPLDAPADVLQDDTLVLRAHRGHGLGAAMKAGNLRLLQQELPDASRVHTYTAWDNAPMQAVNRAFGFRVVERLHEMEWSR